VYKEIAAQLESDIIFEAPDGFEEAVMNKIGCRAACAEAMALGIFSILVGIFITVSMYGGEIAEFLSGIPVLHDAYVNAAVFFSQAQILFSNAYSLVSSIAGGAAVIIELLQFPTLALTAVLITAQLLMHKKRRDKRLMRLNG
jgi:hypothetical protein